MPTYPLIHFVVKNQTLLSVGSALLVLAIFIAAAMIASAPLLGAVGVVVALALWFLVKLLGEVVQVIAETLLPR